MNEITLNQHLAIDDLSPWLAAAGTQLTLRLTRAASFDPGTEGIAIGVLRHLILSGTSIQVRCAFRPMDEGRPQGLLDGLFGTYLLFAAQSVFAEGVEQVDIRSELLRDLWQYIKRSEGEIGDGKRRTIIFRDPDYSIPECLRESVATRFPYPNKFKSLLKRMSLHLAGSAEMSNLPAENSIANFLYEAALNAHEHARGSVYREDDPPTTIRGIVLEKLIFNSPEELKRRGTLSPALREYLARAWSSGMRQISFLSATVADVGPGIQKTLPELPGETPWQCLNRAFESGVTRKPFVPGKGLGEGLPHILDAASVLKAYFIISSADLLGVNDFTEEVSPKVGNYFALILGN